MPFALECCSVRADPEIRIKQCTDKLPEDRQYLIHMISDGSSPVCFGQALGTLWALALQKVSALPSRHSSLIDQACLLDLLVCVALGVDMVRLSSRSLLGLSNILSIQADCVFPTRTARFGVALTFNGPLNMSETERVHVSGQCSPRIHRIEKPRCRPQANR